MKMKSELIVAGNEGQCVGEEHAEK